MKVARPSLEAIFDVRPELRAGLTPGDQAFVAGIVDGFEPVTTPTLVIHARDDGINSFALGQYTAQHIPGAVFMPLATGGNLLLGHQPEISARVSAALKMEEQVEPHLE